VSVLERLKPRFWKDRSIGGGPFKHLFDFRQIWKLVVVLSVGIVLVPVVSMAVFDYRVTRNAIRSEILLRTKRLVSNTRRTISFFLAERIDALDFIVEHHQFLELCDQKILNGLLHALQKAFAGGFSDIGIIDSSGRQVMYVGPYKLVGIDYSHETWFKAVLQQGSYISDVFEGFRQAPHLVIAVKQDLPRGGFYILRVTLDTEHFNGILAGLDISARGDAFLVNHEGTIQTPPRYYGSILEKMTLPVPQFSSESQVQELKSDHGKSFIVGYAYVEGSPFILMILQNKDKLMEQWHKTRAQLIGFVTASLTVIVLVILSIATYLVNKIYLADENRLMTLHHSEHANKMASIGRLAAGVAHEINNPLAIINEKAGLIKDLFTFKQEYAEDWKLTGLVDSIIASVERCGAITRRLLSFARHMDVSIEPVNIMEVIDEVVGLLGKEAEYRSITVNVRTAEDIPVLQCDRGKLQQIFLNLVNNAFAAMSDGGKLEIDVSRKSEKSVLVKVADNGCGIPTADLDRIFEPFFSTRKKHGGTGLGLSITFGLVREIGGEVDVQSEVGKGTSFIITLPLAYAGRKTEIR
jgi:signal transduction histidine kinase